MRRPWITGSRSSYRRQHGRIAEILVESLRGDTWQAPSPRLRELSKGCPLTGLAEAAAFHGIGGYVAQAFRRLPEAVDPALRDRLNSLCYHAVAGHMRAIHDLGRLRELLDRDAGTWAVVKGPVLSEAVYSLPGLRSYRDLDLVIAPARFARTVESLERAGWKVLVTDWWPRGGKDLSGEIPLRSPSGSVVDLHWHLLNYQRERAAFTLPMGEILRHVREVRIGGRAVPTLDEPDTLLHLALHGCISGGNRLVWLKDIEQCIANTAPDWSTVVDRARRWGTALVTAVMLAKARRVVNAQVPDEVLRDLAPGRAWMRLSGLAGRVAPVEAATDRGSFDRLVTRATRANLASSSHELLLRSSAWAAASLPRHVVPPKRTGVATLDGRSTFFEAVSQAVHTAAPQ
ncbi:MAG: nucleotidyltransferase family protein [Egibacteraceae bacterium]